MERRDLYNIEKQRTGETILKGETIPIDRYILVVLVLIENSKNEILVQKRSIQKDGEYGLTSGHPKAGENSVQGMITEIREELGLNVQPDELKLAYTERDDKKRCFFDLYYLKKDFEIKDLKLQKEEVDFVQWCSLKEIEEICLRGEFKKSHKEALDGLIKINKI